MKDRQAVDIADKLDQLLALSGENEVVEFKEAKNNFHFDKLGKYFSALSNEANLKNQSSAWLVFGVNNSHKIVGTQYRPDINNLNSLKGEIAKQTTPRLTFIEIHLFEHANGRVILFEIPVAPSGMPVAFKGHYYGRDGEELGPLNIGEIEHIRQQVTMKDWSSEICVGATLEDLSEEAIALARQEYTAKHSKIKHEIESWDTLTFLNKAKLTIKGQITRTAILLLGNPESAHWLNPASATISWILKDKDGLEKDYEHFASPLLMSAQTVFNKIRNLKYRYMKEGTLFPEEIDQYDPYIIREALNNAIAHQDYELAGKIIVVEFEDGRLCFSNPGAFIPVSVEQVIQADAPETRYRNRFLTDAMVNLNMIDTIGSGIRKMFMIQKNRFFPLPEYNIQPNKVQVTITGYVLDINYARKLAEIPDMKLEDIMLLDRVQKRKSLTTVQATHLKQLCLIEGRRPNFYISARVADHSGDKAQYIRNKGFDDQHYKKMICDYLKSFGTARRVDIDNLLLDKLPDVLDQKQKSHKVKNLLQALKLDGKVVVDGKLWTMSKS